MAIGKFLSSIAAVSLVSFMLSGCSGGDAPITTTPQGPVAYLIHVAAGVDNLRGGGLPFPNTIGTEASSYAGTTQTISTLTIPGTTQKILAPRYAAVLPWHDEHGELNFTISLSGRLSVEELAPVDFQGRSVVTSTGADTTFDEDMRHGLGGDWRAFEISKRYTGAGTLSVNVATDAKDTHALEQPWVGRGGFGRNIGLRDIPLPPAGLDWQVVEIKSGHLAGSLDGAPGRFTCINPRCFLEYNRFAPASGYYPGLPPQESGPAVLFTPDDPALAATTLPSITNVNPMPPADYIAFGSWLYVPENIESFPEYDFGVFAGGGNPYLPPGLDLARLAGTATYAGSAMGRYFTGTSSRSPRAGSFDADVTLTADFDKRKLGGRVENFRFNAAAAGFPAVLDLEFPEELSNMLIDPVEPPEAVVAAGVVTGGKPTSPWIGEWRAAFYGDGANTTDHPGAVAGTFGASNYDSGLAGSFGAYRK